MHAGEDPIEDAQLINEREFPFDVTCNSSHTDYLKCPVNYSQIHTDGTAAVQVFCYGTYNHSLLLQYKTYWACTAIALHKCLHLSIFKMP